MDLKAVWAKLGPDVLPEMATDQQVIHAYKLETSMKPSSNASWQPSNVATGNTSDSSATTTISNQKTVPVPLAAQLDDPRVAAI